MLVCLCLKIRSKLNFDHWFHVEKIDRWKKEDKWSPVCVKFHFFCSCSRGKIQNQGKFFYLSSIWRNVYNLPKWSFFWKFFEVVSFLLDLLALIFFRVAIAHFQNTTMQKWLCLSTSVQCCWSCVMNSVFMRYVFW